MKRHVQEYSGSFANNSKKQGRTRNIPHFPLTEWIKKLRPICKLKYVAKKTNLINRILSEKSKSGGILTVNIIYRKFHYEQS